MMKTTLITKTTAPSHLSRGVRNNNPLNIRHNRKNRWEGMAEEQPDHRFVRFVSPVMGYRAAFVTLKNGYFGRGVNTIGRIIARWAPSADGNDTQAYIDYVSRHTGIAADEPLHFGQERQMVDMVCAMTQMESGIVADRHTVDRGYLMALETGKELK